MRNAKSTEKKLVNSLEEYEVEVDATLWFDLLGQQQANASLAREQMVIRAMFTLMQSSLWDEAELLMEDMKQVAIDAIEDAGDISHVLAEKFMNDHKTAVDNRIILALESQDAENRFSREGYRTLLRTEANIAQREAMELAIEKQTIAAMTVLAADESTHEGLVRFFVLMMKLAQQAVDEGGEQ